MRMTTLLAAALFVTTAGGQEGAGGLPAEVAAAWGVRERSHKGPKPALSLARIVDAGVRVADSEGLDAVSMGRVAASTCCGRSPTAAPASPESRSHPPC